MSFRFEGLDIWHMARGYAAKVYGATAKFPRKEDYGLTSQLNRKELCPRALERFGRKRPLRR